MKCFFFYIFLVLCDSAYGQFLSFDGTKIHFEDQGKGPAVVLVHGFIVNSKMWKDTPIQKNLIETGYRVITLDLRGNGLSDKPHDLKKFENNAEVKDIMGLMKHLNIAKYHVVGYSRGAIITAKLLTLDPNVQTAVLGGMGLDFTNPDWIRPKMFQEAFSGKAHRWPETKRVIEYAKATGADTLCLALMQQAQPKMIVSQLKKIKKPILVISGDQDTDNGKAEDLAKILRKATLKTISGNHNNTASSPDFASEVIQFLSLQ